MSGFVVCWYRDCARQATHEVAVYANGVRVTTRSACRDHLREAREGSLIITSIEKERSAG